MIKYAFKHDWVALKNATKADPQKIGEELERITNEHSGHLEPKHVVEAAKNKRSPLHPHFTWDVQKAAEERWLDQARAIIGSIRKLPDDEDEEGEKTPAFVSIADKGGRSYRTAAAVADSSSLQRALMQQALTELQAFRKRYVMLADLCRLIKTAEDEVRAGLDAAAASAA